MIDEKFAGLELLPSAVMVLDRTLVVRYANPACESLLETGVRSLLGQPFLPMMAEADALGEMLKEALTNQIGRAHV